MAGLIDISLNNLKREESILDFYANLPEKLPRANNKPLGIKHYKKVDAIELLKERSAK